MLIGISGKIGAGKDLVCYIIKGLLLPDGIVRQELYSIVYRYKDKNILEAEEAIKTLIDAGTDIETKRFADALKDIICILIGCTREQLEDRKFKETLLGEDWIRYAYANGFDKQYRNGKEVATVMNSESCTKERYEAERSINWETAYKYEWTPRSLLQYIGTDLFRDKILDNIWINALFSKYIDKADRTSEGILSKKPIYPKWIIPDLRFPNELQAIKNRGGITIRVNRALYKKGEPNDIFKKEHPSETALDDVTFDYTINNNGSIQELINQVKIILTKEELL
jgi:hypothetical protein